MPNGELAVKEPNQAKKRIRGYILKTFITGEEKKPLQIYCAISRSLIRDKVLGNQRRRVLMLDTGGLPLLFIPKERQADFKGIIRFEDEQILSAIEDKKINMKQVSANNYVLVRLTAAQANLLTKLGDEVAGNRELEN